MASLYGWVLLSPPAMELASSEGKRLFSEALQDGTMQGFFNLNSCFQTQSEPAFCGLASLSVVLNAPPSTRGRIGKALGGGLEATTGPPHPTLDSLRTTHRLFARLGRRRDHQALTTMAISTASSLHLHAAPAAHRLRRAAAAAVRFDRRSAVLLLLSAAGAAPPANAAGIGLFGIRKKLERAEEAAAEAVREVEEAAVEAAAVGGEAVKETVVAAGKETREVAGEGLQLVAGAELAGDGLVQAGVVAGAEALGVVVGLSVVNGILRTEA